MATWTTPKSWAVKEVVTAALLNEQLRDNMTILRQVIDALDTANWQSHTGQVETLSTAWKTAGTGPNVNVTTGPVGIILVLITTKLHNSTSGGSANMSYRIRKVSDSSIEIDGSDLRRVNSRGTTIEVETGVWFTTGHALNTEYQVQPLYRQAVSGSKATFTDRYVGAIAI